MTINDWSLDQWLIVKVSSWKWNHIRRKELEWKWKSLIERVWKPSAKLQTQNPGNLQPSIGTAEKQSLETDFTKSKYFKEFLLFCKMSEFYIHLMDIENLLGSFLQSHLCFDTYPLRFLQEPNFIISITLTVLNCIFKKAYLV